MTRTGKIARLPQKIRAELNHRLNDGESGRDLVVWLNALPAVQAILKKEFGGRPILPQNLSEWKLGGYCDWQDQQAALDLVPQLAKEAKQLNAAAGGCLADQFATWLTARLMVMLHRLSAGETDDKAKYKRLRDACSQLVKLRKGDHSAERLKLRRERMALDRQIALHDLEDLFTEWAKRPEIKARFFYPPGSKREAYILAEKKAENEQIFGIDPEYRQKPPPPASNPIKPDQAT